MDVNMIDTVETALDLFEHADGLLAAVPCDDFANSGARWFADKDADGRTEASMELVYQVERIANLFMPTDPEYYEDPDNTFFWAMENPVGRIGTLHPEIGDPFYFEPCEFSGYLDLSRKDIARLNYIRAKDGANVTSEEREFIIRCNAYTKKTGLWGDFNRNIEKNGIEPVKGGPWGNPFMSLGGKSAKTKELRSITPAGFAQAFYEAQIGYQAGKEDFECVEPTGQLELEF